MGTLESWESIVCNIHFSTGLLGKTISRFFYKHSAVRWLLTQVAKLFPLHCRIVMISLVQNCSVPLLKKNSVQQNCRVSSREVYGLGNSLSGHLRQPQIGLNGRPYKLNGRPYKLNGRPYKLNERPYKLNGRSYKLNGRPYKLNGRSYKLNECPSKPEQVYSTNQNAQIRVTWRGQNIFTIIRLPILLMNTHEKRHYEANIFSDPSDTMSVFIRLQIKSLQGFIYLLRPQLN